jgi:ferrochelatase
MSRTAVVLFNLGGPDGQDSVEPFLFNLFNDPAIIGLPGLLRRFVAWRIARHRAPIARRIYAELGGGSPLLPNTEAQARALEARFVSDARGETPSGTEELRAFVCMRYWHPMSEQVARAVSDFAPDRVVLLPLYPQFSTTTTASSLRVWRQAAAAAGLAAPTQLLCCYPSEPGFIDAVAALLRQARTEAGPEARVLFSAHGLPRRVIAKGDPYQDQVERSAAAVAAAAGLLPGGWRVCYQSRVGPLEWIGPATDDEIRRAGAEGTGLIVVPIAFVSEHSETLVELDIEYARLARDSGVPAYVRVPTVGTHPSFIGGLARLVRETLADTRPVRSAAGGRQCAAAWCRCIHPEPVRAEPAQATPS